MTAVARGWQGRFTVLAVGASLLAGCTTPSSRPAPPPPPPRQTAAKPPPPPTATGSDDLSLGAGGGAPPPSGGSGGLGGIGGGTRPPTSARPSGSGGYSGGLAGAVIGAGLGGVIGGLPRYPTEVRGYVLSPADHVPADAVGYAVPIFTDRAQAAKFCPLFLSMITFDGALNAHTPMIVTSYGRKIAITPFVWPVTSWQNTERPDCKLLVERYNISGARSFFDLAQSAIRAAGTAPADALESGPFIMTAQRATGGIVVYDLTRAPDGDYRRWLSRSIQELSVPVSTTSTIVRPALRDQIRYAVFRSIPSWEGVLTLLVPGFKPAASASPP